MSRLLFILPRLFVILFAGTAAGCGHASFTVKIPQEQVVALISKQFPMVRTAGTLTVTLSQPRVHFDGTTDRIGIGSNIDMAMNDLPPGSGTVTIEGSLAAADGAIVLRDVQVRDVILDGAVGDNAEVMKKFISQSLLQSLEGLAIYDLGKDAASRYVAGIHVTDEGLEIRLEPTP